MAYIRSKKVKGKLYQYLVEGYWDKDGKVKQRTIKYLGAANDSKVSNNMVATPVEEKIRTSHWFEADSNPVSLVETKCRRNSTYLALVYVFYSP